MTKIKPLIFITNDDGYLAKGINELIDALQDFAELVVVAPDGPRSGMSSAITSLHPIRIRQVKDLENLKIYSCTGTPVDCVKLGLSQILKDRQPDMVVTGINHGSNASICVHYSGTMGAAIEGCIFKIPSIGFSLLDHNSDADFNPAKPFILDICRRIYETKLPNGVCLNVNIPEGNDLKGIKVCQQAMGQWVEEFKEGTDGHDQKIFWLTGHFRNDEPNNTNTDEWALAQGYISVVPINVDATAYKELENLRGLEK